MNIKLKIALAVFLSPLALGLTDAAIGGATGGSCTFTGCDMVTPPPIYDFARPVLCPIDTITARAISIVTGGDVETYSNARWNICRQSGESISTAVVLDFFGVKHIYSPRPY